MNKQPSDSASLPHSSECSRALDDLGAFLDGELTPDACVRLKEHLEDCESCRREEAALREDWRLLAKMMPAYASVDPETFLAGVRGLIRRDRRRRFVRIAVSAAAAAALCFVLWPGDVDLNLIEDEPIIQSLAAVEDLHGEIDPQILNLLAMNPDLFLPPVADDEGTGYLVEYIIGDGSDDFPEESIDDIIDFLLDESEGQKL